MWTYRQSSGLLTDASGTFEAVGYSGAAHGRNNPALQGVADVGPIPQGRYVIGPPEALSGGPHGPYVLPLAPAPTNDMNGRAGFLIHGDNMTHTASEGCIILSRATRETIAASEDYVLDVVA